MSRPPADYKSNNLQLSQNEHELDPVNAKRVILVDDSGNPYTAGVSGTVSVSGTVGVSGGPVSISGTVPVSGTVGISGTVPVSGTVTALPSGTQAVSGSVSVINTVAVSEVYQANAAECYLVGGDTIPGSGDSPLLVATLTDDRNEMRASDTTGEFIGVYSDSGATTQIAAVGPGMDGVVGVDAPMGTTVYVKYLTAASGASGSYTALTFVKRLI